ncbi:MAG: M18 family aminopeptidase [Simkaniaceae bacterium]|nr:M18 family aminopeptidase [Simkaniaceae bacterium]
MNFNALSDLVSFLRGSPTAWHATREIGNRLAQQDYTPLNEQEKWELKPGGCYFVERGGSISAFILPKEVPRKATILASHTDSPALKLKPHPIFIEDNLPFLRVETYGSPILSTWMNRDLVIAGRILVDEGEKVEQDLLFLENAPVMIPGIAMHLEKEANDNPKKIDKQHQLCPLVGMGGKDKNPEKIFEELIGQKITSVLGSDLYLVPFDSPRILGLHSDLIASYRIDNLAGAHASLIALLAPEKQPKDTIQMTIFWNHEEVGSGSDEGASSPFLSDLLKRISLSYKIGEENFLRMKQTSQIISIDMAHAYHPRYKAKYDKENAPKIGEGIVIKYNANQRYATDGLTAAKIVKICQNKQIPHQSFASESNLPCGSTVGAITAARTGIQTVDIGLAQFSMHAAREMIAIHDHLNLCKLLKAILET